MWQTGEWSNHFKDLFVCLFFRFLCINCQNSPLLYYPNETVYFKKMLTWCNVMVSWSCLRTSVWKSTSEDRSDWCRAVNHGTQSSALYHSRIMSLPSLLFNLYPHPVTVIYFKHWFCARSSYTFFLSKKERLCIWFWICQCFLML